MIKSIKVSLKHTNYNVYIGHDLIEKADHYHKEFFKVRPKIVAFDASLSNTAMLKTFLKKLGKNTKRIPIPSGEKSKSIKALEILYDNLLSAGIQRDTVIYAYGGGVIGDLVGFAAATILRGVDYVQIPTTLLSQIDSSVGGKTAINSSYGKNLIGAFYQPKLVLIDIDTLSSLPQKQMKTGYAEMIKYAIINDLRFFEWLEKNGKNILSKNNEYIGEAIFKCVFSKAKIVSEDEKDKNKRTLLNLGHTFAHAFEKNSNFNDITHGEAVSVGLVLATRLSYKLYYCELQDSRRVENHLRQLGLPTEISNLFTNNIKADKIIKAMQLDKKTFNKIIRFILIRGIGKAFICDKVLEKDLKKFLIENGAT